MLLKKTKTLVFADSPKHTISKMRATMKSLPNWKSTLPQCYIFFMDIRFVGGWSKKDDLAKFWGWTMAAYSNRFFLVLSWILTKKIFSALNKNWLDGEYNAGAHVAIYSIDLLLYAVARPFRDRTVSFSQVVGSCTNLCGILIAALPILLDVDLIPDWLNSSLMMAVSTLGTLCMAAQALMDPVFLFAGTFFQVTGQVTETLGKCNVGGICSALGMALWVRFQKICMARTKTASAATVRKAREQASVKNLLEHGDGAAALIFIEHHCKGMRKGAMNQYKQRYFLLRKGTLRWYNIDHLATVDGDDDIDFGNSPVLGSLKISAFHTVTKVKSIKESQYHKEFGDGHGFVLQADDPRSSERIMFHSESMRDEWVTKIELVIQALSELKKGKGVVHVAGGRDSFRISASSKGTNEDLRTCSLKRKDRGHSSRSTRGEQEVTGARTPHKTLSIKSAGAETAGICDEVIDIEGVIGGRKVDLDGRDKGAFYAPSLQSECYVEIEIILAPEAWRVGMEEIVADGVRCDVTRALDGCRESVLVHRVDRGSGVVHMVLREGVCGESKFPIWSAYELQRQFQDSSSHLRQGAMSSMARSVRIVAEVISDDISFEKLEPMDGSAVAQMHANDMQEFSVVYSEDGQDNNLISEHMEPMNGVAVAPVYDNDMRELSCTPLPPVFQVTGHLVFEHGEGDLPSNLPPLVRVAAASSSDSGDLFEYDDSLPPLVPAAMLAPSPAQNMATANVWRR